MKCVKNFVMLGNYVLQLVPNNLLLPL